jgi:hypothetical protein
MHFHAFSNEKKPHKWLFWNYQMTILKLPIKLCQMTHEDGILIDYNSNQLTQLRIKWRFYLESKENDVQFILRALLSSAVQYIKTMVSRLLSKQHLAKQPTVRCYREAHTIFITYYVNTFHRSSSRTKTLDAIRLLVYWCKSNFFYGKHCSILFELFLTHTRECKHFFFRSNKFLVIFIENI